MNRPGIKRIGLHRLKSVPHGLTSFGIKEMGLRAVDLNPNYRLQFSAEVARRPGNNLFPSQRQENKRLAAHLFSDINLRRQPAITLGRRNLNMLRTNSQDDTAVSVPRFQIVQLRFSQPDGYSIALENTKFKGSIYKVHAGTADKFSHKTVGRMIIDI